MFTDPTITIAFECRFSGDYVVSPCNMKVPILMFVLFITKFCDCRVATSEADVESGQVNVGDKRPRIACTLRTLNVADPYPSVIVKWRGKVNALTWSGDKKEVLNEDYKLPTVSHSYPGSGGLSGGESSAPKDPFSDATIIPDSYTSEDILTFFREDCKIPY